MDNNKCIVSESFDDLMFNCGHANVCVVLCFVRMQCHIVLGSTYLIRISKLFGWIDFNLDEI